MKREAWGISVLLGDGDIGIGFSQKDHRDGVEVVGLVFDVGSYAWSYI